MILFYHITFFFSHFSFFLVVSHINHHHDFIFLFLFSFFLCNMVVFSFLFQFTLQLRILKLIFLFYFHNSSFVFTYSKVYFLLFLLCILYILICSLMMTTTKNYFLFFCRFFSHSHLRNFFSPFHFLSSLNTDIPFMSFYATKWRRILFLFCYTIEWMNEWERKEEKVHRFYFKTISLNIDINIECQRFTSG